MAWVALHCVKHNCSKLMHSMCGSSVVTKVIVGARAISLMVISLDPVLNLVVISLLIILLAYSSMWFVLSNWLMHFCRIALPYWRSVHLMSNPLWHLSLAFWFVLIKSLLVCVAYYLCCLLLFCWILSCFYMLFFVCGYWFFILVYR